MALQFVSGPTLRWEKIKGKEQDGEVLCVCVRIENTGAIDETTSITFRGYTPDNARPPGPGRETTLCEGIQIMVPKHTTIEECCCKFQREIIEISNRSNHKAWLVVECADIKKSATTEGTELHIPKTSKSQ